MNKVIMLLAMVVLLVGVMLVGCESAPDNTEQLRDDTEQLRAEAMEEIDSMEKGLMLMFYNSPEEFRDNADFLNIFNEVDNIIVNLREEMQTASRDQLEEFLSTSLDSMNDLMRGLGMDVANFVNQYHEPPPWNRVEGQIRSGRIDLGDHIYQGTDEDFDDALNMLVGRWQGDHYRFNDIIFRSDFTYEDIANNESGTFTMSIMPDMMLSTYHIDITFFAEDSVYGYLYVVSVGYNDVMSFDAVDIYIPFDDSVPVEDLYISMMVLGPDRQIINKVE